MKLSLAILALIFSLSVFAVTSDAVSFRGRMVEDIDDLEDTDDWDDADFDDFDAPDFDDGSEHEEEEEEIVDWEEDVEVAVEEATGDHMDIAVPAITCVEHECHLVYIFEAKKARHHKKHHHHKHSDDSDDSDDSEEHHHVAHHAESRRMNDESPADEEAHWTAYWVEDGKGHSDEIKAHIDFVALTDLEAGNYEWRVVSMQYSDFKTVCKDNGLNAAEVLEGHVLPAKLAHVGQICFSDDEAGELQVRHCQIEEATVEAEKAVVEEEEEEVAELNAPVSLIGFLVGCILLIAIMRFTNWAKNKRQASIEQEILDIEKAQADEKRAREDAVRREEKEASRESRSRRKEGRKSDRESSSRRR